MILPSKPIFAKITPGTTPPKEFFLYIAYTQNTK